METKGPEVLLTADLIGKTITAVRFVKEPENEFGFEEFYTYLQLEEAVITDIPTFYSEIAVLLNEENTAFLKDNFEKGERPASEIADQIEGKQVTDLWFHEPAYDQSAFIQLSNDYYLSETTFGMTEAPSAGLRLLTQKEFELAREKEQLKSYLENLRKV